MDERCFPRLSKAELREFSLIVTSARRAGWIASGLELTAALLGRNVVVAASGASTLVCTKCYPNLERWLLDLLHDLAHGMWRAASTTGTSTAELGDHATASA